MIKKIVLLVILIFVLQNSYAYSVFDASFNKTFNAPFSIFCNQENVTINGTTPFNVKLNFSANNSQLNNSDGKLVIKNKINNLVFNLTLSNDKNWKLKFLNLTPEELNLKFGSSWVLPQTLWLKIPKLNFSWQKKVFGNQVITIKMPFNLVKELNLTKEHKLNMTYGLNNDNKTFNITMTMTSNIKPDFFIVSEKSTIKAMDLLKTMVVMTNKIVPKSINVTTNLNSTITISKNKDYGWNVYIMPRWYGEYRVSYNVTTIFGKTATKNFTFTALPSDTIFFNDLSFPMIKVNRPAKFLIYDGGVHRFEFRMENIKGTVATESNVTVKPEDAINIYLTDSSGTMYYLNKNSTVSLFKNKIYLNINPLKEGNYSFDIKVSSKEPIKINPKFHVKFGAGPFDIFEDTYYNVNGRTVHCHLLPQTNAGGLERQCSVTYPVVGKEDLTNDLYIFTRWEYNNMQKQYNTTITAQEQKYNFILKNKNTLILTLSIVALLLFIGTLYFAYPKGWIAI